MTLHNIPDADFNLDVARGINPKISILHKFGRNKAVSTTYAPISIGGVYQTPQVSGATTLRVKAGNANDTSNGTGARTITLVGLNASGQEITETISTAGASNGTASTNAFLRLYRAHVATSGTYGTSAAGSHSADIVIENSAGGTTWATIDYGNFPKGQTEIGVYTVPLGYNAYINNISFSVESTKVASVLLFQRQGILDTAAPYSSIRLIYNLNGVDGTTDISDSIPVGPYPALTDIGFMSRVTSGTAIVSVNFEVILESTT
jgi:hypothetical protein